MTEMQTNLPGRESKERSFKSRRDLTGIARSIANKFACSLQHYAWLARHYGITTVTVDLLTPRIFPEPFDIERNRILAAMCRQNLDDLLKRLPPPTKVLSAELTSEFEIHDAPDDEYGRTIGRTTVAVLLTDERSKQWVGVHVVERTLAQE